MLSLLLVSLLAAGVAHGQEAGMFSDCATQQDLINTCADQHLSYLNDEAKGNLKLVANLPDGEFIISQQLNVICNEDEGLMKYFKCVFGNLTTCLQNANSSQADYMPSTTAISTGISELCEGRNDLNLTCIEATLPQVASCHSSATSDQSQQTDPCMIAKELSVCLEKLSVCQGGDLLRDYAISALPHTCELTNAAGDSLVSLTGLLVMLSVSLLVSWL